MMLWLEIRRRIRVMLGPLVMCSVAAYFIYHATYGDRGFFAVVTLNERIAEAEQIRAHVAERKAGLEARVALLKAESLDPDLLEERTRLLLDMAHPNDRIILYRSKDEGRERPVRVTRPGE